MPVAINDVEALKGYIEGVMNRAGHHAKELEGIALTLVGAIVWRKDQEPILVRPYGEGLGNVLTVSIGGRPYVFRYEHRTREIEMRHESLSGEVAHAFSGSTSVLEIARIFREL
jgi:hypothetical protein